MRCDDDGQKNQYQYDDTSHGKRILAQASHTILEKCGRLTHDILLLLFLICRLLEICLIEFAQIYLCRQNLSMFQLHYFYPSFRTLLKCDSWIDELICNIGQQVCHNHQNCEENCRCHNHRIVSVGNTCYERRSQSSDGKNILNNHGTCQNVCNHRSHISDNRNQRVAQRMFENDFPARNTFRSRGTDVILVQGIQHTGLCQTCDVRHRINTQRDNRQYIVRTRGRPYREPAEL